MSSEEVEAIDNLRRQRPDLPSRSEAIRRLIIQGMAGSEGGVLAFIREQLKEWEAVATAEEPDEAEFIRAGVADLLARPEDEWEMLMSHLLDNEAIKAVRAKTPKK